MPAGEGVQHIEDIKPVAQIIAEMTAQAHAIIARVASGVNATADGQG
jgi:hypothetical protein